jgi:HPt (histidine-containing phosphotransfer) domain-containing protein
MNNACTDVPVLDLLHLDQISQLEQFKPGLSAHLLSLFEANSQNQLQLLLAALSAGDHDEVRRVAHSIKGLASSMGAGRLSCLAANLEALAEAGSQHTPGKIAPEWAQQVAAALAVSLYDLTAWAAR